MVDAFASPDNQNMSFSGVPDGHCGTILARATRHYQRLIIKKDVDTYLVVTPSPTVAYYVAEVAQDAAINNLTAFAGKPWTGASDLFPIGSENSVVSEFRQLLTAIEIKPLVNEFTWTGSIEVWKLPLVEVMEPVKAVDDHFNRRIWAGTQGLNADQVSKAIFSFNEGCYTIATARSNEFPFTPVVSSVGPTFPIDAPIEANMLGLWVGDYVGLGNLDTVVIKLSGATADQPVMLRMWNYLEMIPVSSNILYSFASDSPPPDVLAMRAYRILSQRLPLAVTAAENANFGTRLLHVLGVASKALSLAPGKVGKASSVVSEVLSLLPSSWKAW